MKYVAETVMSKQWGISEIEITKLCSEGKIPGAQLMGTYWIIPDDAKKPED